MYDDNKNICPDVEPSGVENLDVHMNEFWQRLTACSDIPLDRLEEICAAERDGRLIVPPCNVGDTVWVTMAYGETLNPPKKTVVNWFKQHYDGILEARLWMDLGNGYKEYGYGIESFGKIVFLTREEAEKALKGAEKEAQ
jgi:hypothetical protein